MSLGDFDLLASEEFSLSWLQMKKQKKNQPTLRLQDGHFDYDEYVRIETETNRNKFSYTSFSWDELDCIVKNFKTQFSPKGRPPFILCQGVRNGAELHSLSKRMGFRVVGTDISDTILGVQNGVMMDFHDCPKIWFEKVDFLYSNAWDQSNDIASCLAHWGKLLSERGVLYLQHTPNHLKDTGISVTALKDVMALGGIRCDETLSVSQPPSVVIFFRRLKKFFARLQGKSLPMSRSSPDTFILVGRRPARENERASV